MRITSTAPKTPRTGNMTIGISAVIARGIASVTHQAAINRATARAFPTAGLSGSGSVKKKTKINSRIPVKNPTVLLVSFIYSLQSCSKYKQTVRD